MSYTIVAFIVSFLCAWWISRYACRLGLMDIPNQRSSHDRETPKGGGVGILAAFFLCSVLNAVPAYFYIPATLLALVSFWGDRSELSVFVRLFCQLFLTLCFLTVAAVYHFNHPGVWSGLGLSLFYLLFIVGTANYYNFMDGINGIAAITGIVAFGLLGEYSSQMGKDPALLVLSFSMMAACIGFLPFNAPNARVFMGDVGSVLLGFVFSGLVVLMASSVAEFFVLSGFLFPFYADELITLFERLRDGESPSQPHRRHFYQVLANEEGLAHWRVSVGYGVAQFLVGLSVWRAASAGLFLVLGTLAAFFIIFMLINNRVKRYCGILDQEK